MFKPIILSILFFQIMYANPEDIAFISTQSESDLKRSFIDILSKHIAVQEDLQPWGKNPFFNQNPLSDIEKETEKNRLPADKSIHNFEYRFMATWEHNQSYKAMISGHILSKNDSFHNLEIIHISSDSVTIKKEGVIHIFQVGQSVYDHEI